MAPRLKLAVWKFASCDGCQLSLLDLEDHLLALAGKIDIAYFLEASRAVEPGPYDLSLVEGSITTAEDAKRIKQVRRVSKLVIPIGACATAGGIQALRNFTDVKEYIPVVYAHPEYIKTLERSTPISENIKVDFEIQGCPINKNQLLEVIKALLQGKAPRLSAESVCVYCKIRGTICVMVADGTPCMGPVTHTGCGAPLPHLPPGLLWLLWSQRSPQHCFPNRTISPDGCVGGRHHPPLTDLQRLCRTLSSGEPGP